MLQPPPVVTVTINPAIDQTLVIPNFAAGAVNRVQSARTDAGGKGINVASFLADYGVPAIATGFLGRENDAIFGRLFAEKRIGDQCVRIAGPTRVGLKIVDPVRGQTTDINFPGELPTPEDVGRLTEILLELARAQTWFVLSGSLPRGLPPTFYANLVAMLQGHSVVLDTSGEALAAALTARPTVIKPNIDELAELVQSSLSSVDAVLAAAAGLMSRYHIQTVVVSMGAQGALFVEGREALWAIPPEVDVVSTVGAGDALVAGLVAGKRAGLGLDGCAPLATAFAATAIGRPGHSLPDQTEVAAMARRVLLRDLARG